MTDPDEELRRGGSTSHSLLAGAKRAEPSAWNRMVALYAPAVAGWCRKWGVAEQDLSDVVQDVFVAVARHFEQFRHDRPRDTFRGWMATIARNKANDYFRRRSSEPAAAGGTEATRAMQQMVDPQAAEDVPLEADLAFDDVLQRALDGVRGEFHERTWQAFFEVVLKGRAAGDVALELNMKPGAVRVAKSRVLARLRRELGDAPP